ncbi:MAG: DUF6171 family protein [Treponema sp.]|jgi:hypothetical protein|nr:DUF6171 family protein [Treponema sp.]
MKEPEGRGPCPRCGDGALAALTPEHLTALSVQSPIPASLRAGAGVYRRRLRRCGACDALRERVLCAYCGCFVQIRAAVLTNRCPSPAGDKWAACSKITQGAG